MQQRGGYVSGGPWTVTSPYSYWYSDPYYHYYYCYYNGGYYYTRVPAVGMMTHVRPAQLHSGSATSTVTPGSWRCVRTPACGFMQSLTWAELQAPGGRGLSAALAARRPDRGRGDLPGRPLVDGSGILVTPGGPLVPWRRPGGRAAVLFAAIRREACRLRRQTGSILWRIEPRLSPPLRRPCAWVRHRAPVDLDPFETKRSGPLGWDDRRPRLDDVKRPV